MPKLNELLATAVLTVSAIRPEDAVRVYGRSDVIFVDLRESAELDLEGFIPGARHIPRGLLEFAIDCASPCHDSVFSSGKELIFYCTSGPRSVLAAAAAKSMGLTKVCHIAGGLNAWRDAGGPIEWRKYRPDIQL